MSKCSPCKLKRTYDNVVSIICFHCPQVAQKYRYYRLNILVCVWNRLISWPRTDFFETHQKPNQTKTTLTLHLAPPAVTTVTVTLICL